MSGEALRGDMYVRLHLSAALSEQEKKNSAAGDLTRWADMCSGNETFANENQRSAHILG